MCGGGANRFLPDDLELFFNGLFEKATLEYEISELDKIRLECVDALKLNMSKLEQVPFFISCAYICTCYSFLKGCQN
jgi:hypothetical protein